MILIECSSCIHEMKACQQSMNSDTSSSSQFNCISCIESQEYLSATSVPHTLTISGVCKHLLSSFSIFEHVHLGIFFRFKKIIKAKGYTPRSIYWSFKDS